MIFKPFKSIDLFILVFTTNVEKTYKAIHISEMGLFFFLEGGGGGGGGGVLFIKKKKKKKKKKNAENWKIVLNKNYC